MPGWRRGGALLLTAEDLLERRAQLLLRWPDVRLVRDHRALDEPVGGRCAHHVDEPAAQPGQRRLVERARALGRERAVRGARSAV